jgi:hypothetical protein
LLPFEFVPTVGSAAATRALVEKQTWELALAVVEYAMMGFEDDTDDDALAEERGGAVEPGNPAWFARHARSTVADFLPTDAGGYWSSSASSSSSGFEVAQALRSTLDDDRK